MIKIRGDNREPFDIINQLNFKELDLPIFSNKRCECTVQERLSDRGYFLSCMLFNEDYTNERLLGAVETLISILTDEENIDKDLRESLTQFEILISKRELAKNDRLE